MRDTLRRWQLAQPGPRRSLRDNNHNSYEQLIIENRSNSKKKYATTTTTTATTTPTPTPTTTTTTTTTSSCCVRKLGPRRSLRKSREERCEGAGLDFTAATNTLAMRLYLRYFFLDNKRPPPHFSSSDPFPNNRTGEGTGDEVLTGTSGSSDPRGFA